ncbi:hypothetical protein MARINOS108_10459 [Marinoscillum sp. 108]|nr:hypothetical protein MARINOS108_10459 [Marinoscillum sp. 108]
MQHVDFLQVFYWLRMKICYLTTVKKVQLSNEKKYPNITSVRLLRLSGKGKYTTVH